MRIVDLSQQPGRDIRAFGSDGFAMSRIGAAEHVASATLASGGTIGRHDTETDQVLLVVAGHVVVVGSDGNAQELQAGQAAVWIAGETHETRALARSILMLIEGEGVGAALV